ncbi:MAG: ABC transporter permease [Rhodothermaceae bacterium]|uniref:MlaE family ABC transporter permease n=1 Tax=Rubrivirga sp. SAORIC476 TaxID=1961794 RepID=UPI000BA9B110|nr:ABC transporter permease [Rubrivirga sp. SAORIC476]MAQ93228.1 ABC transporter permease [Rhodothermaceae bacterium]MBC14475.1 ABC transporter permease [Rhodothermaceae bacterium]
MEPLPTDSLTQRLRAGRRARQNEKILQEKDIERKTEERQEAARTQSVPGEAFFAEVGGLFGFIGRFLSRVWRRPFEVKELINQMDEVGVKSLTLTGVVGFSIGIVLAMQSRGTLARFGAESFLPSMLALSVIKEIGPVLTSLVLAGRLGAGMGAELGSMKVTEQIDALEVAALKPFHYLVITRVLACVIMFPIMTMISDILALTGGYLEAWLSDGMDIRVFIATAFDTLRFVDVGVDTMKTSVFGFIVGIVSCYLGYNVRGGTREVGRAAMQAVVISSLLILLADVVVVRLSIMIFGDISGSA